MTTGGAALNAERRRIEIDQSADDTVDVLVIGGGITGAGVALDAAARGLRVTLIEAEDLAFGTSRFSSKLVHGGLRYLATGDVATARESAIERHHLMSTIAPHLIRPLAQVLPFAPGVSVKQRAAGAVGMAVGDLLRVQARTRRSVLPGPRPVSPRTVLRLAPAVTAQGLRGGMLSYDGQLIDDARLVVAVARTAAALGARILTRVRAITLRPDGAAVEDSITGERWELGARSVVNATGVWAGSLDESITVRPSRGTHIVLDAADLGYPLAALTVPLEGSISRYIFALPQQLGRVIVGLTDEDAPGPIPRIAEPTEGEISFLLANVNRVLTDPIGRERVRGAFAGLRPLVDSGVAATADVSRRHLVATSETGFVTVLGGKLTTYRRMAEDAVDRIVAERGVSAPGSTTTTLPLVRDGDVPGQSTDGVGGSFVADGIPVTRAAVEYAVREELALTAEDVLDRRTRIGLVPDERERAAPIVEEIVAETLSELR